MKKLIIFIMVLTSILSTKDPKSQVECTVEQPYITFGDYFFDKDQSFNYYTIGAIIRGKNCNIQILILQHGGKKDYLYPVKMTPYTNGNYTAISYLFYIPLKYKDVTHKWVIETKNDFSGPHEMPSQGSNHPSDQAVVAFFADMDKSIISKPLTHNMKTWNPSDFDMILHGGDFAYNIDSKDGTVGDEYFQMMSDIITTKLPYVVAPGNHECSDGGKYFNFRFKMPGGGDPLGRGTQYYGFNYKGVHYVTINADYIFKINPSEKLTVLSWLETDLKKANADPSINFVVFWTHRPFYCPYTETLTTDHCRIFYHWRPFEVMLRKYKVDLWLSAHFHAIFRLKKQEDFVNFSGEAGEDQPLMIVAGSNGALHSMKDTPPKTPMTDFGYFGFSAWLQITTTPKKIIGKFLNSESGEILDQFIIEKKFKKIK